MKGKRDPFKIEREGTHYLTGKLVGGYISQRAHAYLRLLAVYSGGSMQSNLQQMLEDWMENKATESFIIDALAERAVEEWRRRDLSEKRAKGKWDEFEEEMGSYLVKKKIEFETIEKIRHEMRKIRHEMRLKVGKIR
jgi:hypothetical protein